MSIIHEALKKVQANLQGLKSDPTPASNVVPLGEHITPPPPPRPSQEATAVPSVAERPKTIPVATETPAAVTKKSQSVLPLILAFAILAAAGWIAYPYIFGKKPELPKIALPMPQKPPQHLAQVKITPGAESPASNAPIVLNIQGVMENNGRTVALIDDKIYEAGDEIAGIKILSIDVEAITVLRNGTEETIRVRK